MRQTIRRVAFFLWVGVRQIHRYLDTAIENLINKEKIQNHENPNPCRGRPWAGPFYSTFSNFHFNYVHAPPNERKLHDNLVSIYRFNKNLCRSLRPSPPLLPQLTMNRFLTFVLQGCVVSSDKRKKRNKKLIRVVVRDKSGIMRIYDLMSALDNEIKMNSAH